MFKRSLAALAGLFVFLVALASAQTVPGVSIVSFSTSTTGVVGIVALNNGYGSCSVVVTNAGSGLTAIPQVSSDGVNFVTATNVNTGSIGATGTFTGAVSPQGLLTFQLNVTALASGTFAGTVTCSTAPIPGTVSVNVPNPLPVSTPAAGFPVNQGTNPWIIFVQPTPLPVSTPAGGFQVTQPTAANFNITDNPASTAIGYASQRFYPVGTLGGGCVGVTGTNITTGTAIVKNIAFFTITTTTTQIVAPVAGKIVHICHIAITGNFTTAGTIGLLQGTGTNCGTGTVTDYQVVVPVGYANIVAGDGADNLFDNTGGGLGNGLCLGGAVFVATAALLDIAYAQY